MPYPHIELDLVDELSDSKLNKLGKYKNKLVVSKHNKVNEIIKYLK